MSQKMEEATEATTVAIEQNGLENGASSSTSSDTESEAEDLDRTKGDEDRQMDEKKAELLKVIINNNSLTYRKTFYNVTFSGIES